MHNTASLDGSHEFLEILRAQVESSKDLNDSGVPANVCHDKLTRNTVITHSWCPSTARHSLNLVHGSGARGSRCVIQGKAPELSAGAHNARGAGHTASGSAPCP